MISIWPPPDVLLRPAGSDQSTMFGRSSTTLASEQDPVGTMVTNTGSEGWLYVKTHPVPGETTLPPPVPPTLPPLV